MVFGALFLPYFAYQKGKPTAITTGTGATDNYLTQAAPAAATAAAAEIRHVLHVGGAPPEQGPAGATKPSDSRAYW